MAELLNPCAANWDQETKLKIGIAATYLLVGRSSPDRIKRISAWRDAICKHMSLDPEILPHFDKKSQPPINLAIEDKVLANEIVHDLVLVSLGLTASIQQEGDKPTEKPKAAVNYSPLNRACLFKTCKRLAIQESVITDNEKQISEALYAVMRAAQQALSEQEQKDLAEGSSLSKMASSAKAAISNRSFLSANSWKTSATTAGAFILGGAVIGLTGGLAAPLIAPLLVTVSGGALAFLASASGPLIIGSLFGLGAGNLTAKRVRRRMEGIHEFEFEQITPQTATIRPEPAKPVEGQPESPMIQQQPLSAEMGKTASTASVVSNNSVKVEDDIQPSLHAVICCSGFLIKDSDYITQFSRYFIPRFEEMDAYAVKVENEEMTKAGTVLDHYVRNFIIKKGAAEIIKRTALQAVIGAVALPATVYGTLGTAFDNQYQRAMVIAAKAGILLADVLEQKVQGNRPTTLVGTSLGAVTVMTAVLELEKRRRNTTDAALRARLSDLLFDVILISLPASPTVDEWGKIRSMTARRVVNAYSDNDWVLAIVARLHTMVSTRMSVKVAGLSQVSKMEGMAQLDIEDVDISDIIDGHLQTVYKQDMILAKIGIV